MSSYRSLAHEAESFSTATSPIPLPTHRVARVLLGPSLVVQPSPQHLTDAGEQAVAGVSPHQRQALQRVHLQQAQRRRPSASLVMCTGCPDGW